MEQIKTNLISEGYCPRKDFTGKEELKRSIEKDGLLEPILVRLVGKRYIIINGVRRFRAIKELGWDEVPCQIQDVDEKIVAHLHEGDIPGVFFKDSSNMSELADESVGLVVTSPPYGVGMEYEQGISLEDHLKMLGKVFSEAVRVLIPGGKICINFGDIHNFGTRNGGKPEIKLMGHHYQAMLEKHGLRLIDTIAWKKCTPGKRDFNWFANPQANYHDKTRHGTYRIINNTEHIFVFEKDGARNVSPELEETSKLSKEEYYKYNDGVWEIPPVRGEKGHPAPFPEELVRRLINMYSYKGDIVLDPFGGTMTTVKVAKELDRIGIGYEKEKKYKPAIMKKLGISNDDLEKSSADFASKFEKEITDILKEENKTTKDIASIRVPYGDSISKEDIVIEWSPPTCVCLDRKI